MDVVGLTNARFVVAMHGFEGGTTNPEALDESKRREDAVDAIEKRTIFFSLVVVFVVVKFFYAKNGGFKF